MASSGKSIGRRTIAPVDERADLILVEREVGPGAPQRLLTAGLECFAERGFHATTTRDIASRAGMSPAAMYVHYPSKSELLYRLSRLGHQDALRTVLESGSGQRDSFDRLWHIVAAFARWHALHHRLARVAQNELNAVPPAHISEIRYLRQQVSERLQAEVAHGVRTGAFAPPGAHETTRAILSLCIDIARWYTPAGPRTPDELGQIYAELVLRMLRPHGAPAPPFPRGAP